MFNQSVAEGVIPREWKAAVIIPKISKPANPSDFRSKSITSSLVTPFADMHHSQYVYPALHPPAGFADQFAFRPSNSTTAALIAVFHKAYSPCRGIGGTVKREKGRGGY